MQQILSLRFKKCWHLVLGSRKKLPLEGSLRWLSIGCRPQGALLRQVLMWMMLVTLDHVALEDIGIAGLAEAIKDLLIEGGWDGLSVVS